MCKVQKIVAVAVAAHVSGFCAFCALSISNRSIQLQLCGHEALSFRLGEQRWKSTTIRKSSKQIL